MASEKLRKLQLSRARRLTKPPPPIAAEANDLKAIKKAVEDAASVGTPLWLSYLFLLFYVALAASGVKHADLLLENPVELPFLNIKLPLIAFFVIAPILFVIVHAYVMAHFALLSDKAKLFHTELKRQERSHSVREGLRRQLPINLFAQFLAGPVEIREGLFSLLLWAVAWISLVAGPLLVLLLLHVQFLPYHDSRVTWVHRGAVIFDLVIIWCLWMKMLSGRSGADPPEQVAVGSWAKFWNSVLWWSRNIVGWPLTGLIVAFSVLVATFPGEWRQWPYSLFSALEPWATPTTAAIFGKVDPLNKDKKKRITGSWPVNTLRLKEFDIYEALKVEDRTNFDLKEHSYILHDRHLEKADLRFARLGRVDLRNAHLEGASLDEAQLQGASLGGAQLQGASLDEAQLQVASLVEAQLQGASLGGAQLQGASLDNAQLQGASLEIALLQGASLKMAELQVASLIATQLQGASLGGAQMQATNLNGAFIWRADRVPNSSASLTQDLHWGAETLELFHGNQPWTAARYAALRSEIERIVPEGERRTEALKRIEILDCARKDLAPCDPRSKAPPRLALELEIFNASREEREKAFAETLRHIVCKGGEDDIYILRGVTGNRSFPAAGREAPALIDDIIQGKNCPVSAALTEADKARLLEIKKNAEERAAEAEAQQVPAPAPPRPGSSPKKKKPR
jgi:uncharacterized protein YjbI with pentapeptide repeats